MKDWYGLVTAVQNLHSFDFLILATACNRELNATLWHSLFRASPSSLLPGLCLGAIATQPCDKLASKRHLRITNETKVRAKVDMPREKTQCLIMCALVTLVLQVQVVPTCSHHASLLVLNYDHA